MFSGFSEIGSAYQRCIRYQILVFMNTLAHHQRLFDFKAKIEAVFVAVLINWFTAYLFSAIFDAYYQCDQQYFFGDRDSKNAKHKMILVLMLNYVQNLNMNLKFGVFVRRFVFKGKST